MPSNETFSGVHGNGSNSGISEMLGDLKDKFVLNVLNLEGVKNLGEFSFELDIDDGSDDLLFFSQNGKGQNI